MTLIQRLVRQEAAQRQLFATADAALTREAINEIERLQQALRETERMIEPIRR